MILVNSFGYSGILLTIRTLEGILQQNHCPSQNPLFVKYAHLLYSHHAPLTDFSDASLSFVLSADLQKTGAITIPITENLPLETPIPILESTLLPDRFEHFPLPIDHPIYVHRDVRDVIVSVLSRPGLSIPDANFGLTDEQCSQADVLIYILSRQWADHIRSLQTSHLHWHVTSFSELKLSPLETISRLATAIGLPVQAEQLLEHITDQQNNRQHSFMNPGAKFDKWRAFFSPEQIALIDWLTGPEMTSQGYTLSAASQHEPDFSHLRWHALSGEPVTLGQLQGKPYVCYGLGVFHQKLNPLMSDLGLIPAGFIDDATGQTADTEGGYILVQTSILLTALRMANKLLQRGIPLQRILLPFPATLAALELAKGRGLL